MADILSCTEYVSLNIIDIEDWIDSDDERKVRVLNTALNTLNDAFPGLIIPDEAAYDFSPILAAVFNDTNKLNSQGIASFSITGVGSFTFDNEKSLEDLIPSSAIKKIEKANDVSLQSRKIRLKYNV